MRFRIPETGFGCQGWWHRLSALALLVLPALVMTGCGQFAPELLSAPSELTGVQSRTVGDVDVSVAILTDDQARVHFGVDFRSKGIQALWMRIRNASSERLWFIRNVMDPDFYPADEAAHMVRKEVPKREFARVRQHFRDESMRVMIPPATVSQGFVFLPRAEGGRYVDIRLARDASELEPDSSARKGSVRGTAAPHFSEVRVGFALQLPDGIFDYELLDPGHTYANMELPDLETGALRERLEQLPCCAASADGDETGDPLNVVLVGESTNVMNSLSKCGWSFTHRITFKSGRRMIGAALRHKSYPVAPVSSLFLFGRKQDIALQRARTSISQRNHMRLWLAPFRHQGRQVWVGQVSRDIGIKLTPKSPTLTTHIIDPEVDLTREYLLHSLVAGSFVERFGFVKGAPVAPRLEPRLNMTGDPYFTDGMRVVIVLSSQPVPYDRIRSLGWERSAAPISEGQSQGATRNVRPIERTARP